MAAVNTVVHTQLLYPFHYPPLINEENKGQFIKSSDKPDEKPKPGATSVPKTSRQHTEKCKKP